MSFSFCNKDSSLVVMGNKQSHHWEPTKSAKTVFLSKDKEIYRIPSLFYDGDKKIFMVFAEQRRTVDDASTKMLVLKTGTLKEESSDVRTIEVIIQISSFVYELLMNVQFCF